MGKFQERKNCWRGEHGAEVMSSTKNLGLAPERQVRGLALDSSLNHSQHENIQTLETVRGAVEGVSLSFMKQEVTGCWEDVLEFSE